MRPLRAAALAVCSLGSFPVSLAAQGECALDWHLTETLRIGSIDGEDALAGVNELTIGPDGRVYVTQQWIDAITVFSQTGELFGTIGRGGGGPGEFDSTPRGLTWVGEHLWAADRSRTQAFDLAGRPTEQHRFRVRMLDEAAGYWANYPLPDGGFWARRTTFIDPRATPYGPETGLRAVRRFTETGQVIDTIAVLDGRDHFTRFSDQPGEYTPHPLWSLLPAVGQAWGDMMTHDRRSLVLLGEVRDDEGEASFDLLRISVKGDTLLQRSISYEPRPISAEVEAWWRDEYGRFMAGDHTRGLSGYLQRSEAEANQARRAAHDELRMPEHFPPVRRVLAGGDETIWVLREPEGIEGPDRWEVYDYAGDLVGRFQISEGWSSYSPLWPRLDLHHATRDEVWGTTVDEYHVSYIHRFSVTDSCPADLDKERRTPPPAARSAGSSTEGPSA